MIMINNVTERKREVGRETERQTTKVSRGEKERERGRKLDRWTEGWVVFLIWPLMMIDQVTINLSIIHWWKKIFSCQSTMEIINCRSDKLFTRNLTSSRHLLPPTPSLICFSRTPSLYYVFSLCAENCRNAYVLLVEIMT